jgi:hypothetical protein
LHIVRSLRAVLLRADNLAVRFEALLAVGMLPIGSAVIAAGGLIGAMFASPVAPSIEILAAIRLVGIGVFSGGIGLLATPTASLQRALFAYSTLATLYFCLLMLAVTLDTKNWPKTSI